MKLLAKLTMAVFVWLSIPFSVYAADDKVYPGIGCKPFGGAAEATLKATEFYIVNVSNASVPVVCPIVIDFDTTKNSTVVNVQVLGHLRAKDTLSCTAFSAEVLPVNFAGDFGSRIFDRATDSAGDSLHSSAKHGFPISMSINVSTNVNAIHVYSLTCNLPQGGRILNYIVAFS